MDYMYPISTITLYINFRQNPSIYMESSHNALIIHAFNLVQKRFLSASKLPKTLYLMDNVPHFDMYPDPTNRKSDCSMMVRLLNG